MIKPFENAKHKQKNYPREALLPKRLFSLTNLKKKLYKEYSLDNIISDERMTTEYLCQKCTKIF